MPENKQRNDVESQTSPIKETSPQVSVSSTEPFLGNQTGSVLVSILNDSNKKLNSEIQKNETDMTTCDSADDNIFPPAITTSQIEERLFRTTVPMNCTCHCPPQLSSNERKKCCMSLWISRMA